MTNLEKFTDAYLEAVEFTDFGPDSEFQDTELLSPETLLDIKAECRSWWRRFGCFVTTDICKDAFDDPVKQAGYDFHFTRNGHGCGFWEVQWPKCYMDMFDNGSTGYGEFQLYLGDDGLVYA